MQEEAQNGLSAGDSVALSAWVERYVPGADTVSVEFRDFDHHVGPQPQAVAPSSYGGGGGGKITRVERSKIVTVARRLLLEVSKGAALRGDVTDGMHVDVEAVVRSIGQRDGRPWLTVGFDGSDVEVEGPAAAATPLN